MENKIIKEVNRVNKLMGNKNILSESPIPGIAKYLRKIFNSFGDDVAEKIVKTVKSGDDDLLRKLRSGETLSADVVEAVIKALPSDLIAKILVDDILGSAFNKNIDKVIDAIKRDRSRYDELMGKMDEAIEEIGSKNEFDTDIINSMKREVRGKIDDGIGDASTKVDDIDIIGIDINDIMNQASKKAKDVNNIDDFKNALKGFLTENRDRLTPMFTSRDIDRYVEEITGQLDVILSKGKNRKQIKNVENLWSRLPLSEKEKFAREAIENITKKLPLNLKNAIGNPKKFIDRIIKGSNGKFEWSTFWSNLKGLYFKTVLIQLSSEVLRATFVRSEQDSGYEVDFDTWVERLLNGRSYEDFIASLALPPVEWMATVISWTDRDDTYDEIKEMLPASYRDNFYREREGDGMYIKKSGVKYPVYVKDNTIFVNIKENDVVTAYKLEDIAF